MESWNGCSGRMWCGISVSIYNFVERVKGSSFGGPCFLCLALFHQKSDFEVELQSSVLRFVGLLEWSAVGLATELTSGNWMVSLR